MVAAFMAVCAVCLAIWGVLAQQRASFLKYEVNKLAKDVDRLEHVWVNQTQSLATTSAEVEELQNKMNSFDQRLQMMDAWIQTTRDRLTRSGFEPPEYSPPP